MTALAPSSMTDRTALYNDIAAAINAEAAARPDSPAETKEDAYRTLRRMLEAARGVLETAGWKPALSHDSKQPDILTLSFRAPGTSNEASIDVRPGSTPEGEPGVGVGAVKVGRQEGQGQHPAPYGSYRPDGAAKELLGAFSRALGLDR